MTLPVFDVSVIGGGPAGSVTAALLARQGLRVALLGASDFSGGCYRAETITPHIRQPLEGLGTFPSLREGAAPVAGIASAWGTKLLHFNDFLFGVDGPGWQVERPVFDRMLMDLARHQGVEINLGARILSRPNLDGERWQFDFTIGGAVKTCRSQFLVDATGRNGTAWLSHLSSRAVLDKLVSIVWRGQGCRESAYVVLEAIEDGWFYFANVPGCQAIMTLSTDSDLLRQSAETLSRFWTSRVKKTVHIQSLLPNNPDFRILKLVSAATVVRSKPVGKAWCAVGDAAFSQDPLSGLGIYHAIQSAREASHDIVQNLKSGVPLHDYSEAREVERKTYVKAHKLHYGQVRRWPNSNFWASRT
jgi:flavin-dependent dehydrogenase